MRINIPFLQVGTGRFQFGNWSRPPTGRGWSASESRLLPPTLRAEDPRQKQGLGEMGVVKWLRATMVGVPGPARALAVQTVGEGGLASVPCWDGHGED